MAQAGDYMSIMTDTAENSYTEKKLRVCRPLYPLLGRIGKPTDFRRFLIQAHACLTHDAYAGLGRIVCSTLVIGAGQDKIVGPQASCELAGQIDGSRLILYEGFGHAVYEEAADFQTRVLRFLSRES